MGTFVAAVAALKAGLSMLLLPHAMVRHFVWRHITGKRFETFIGGLGRGYVLSFRAVGACFVIFALVLIVELAGGWA